VVQIRPALWAQSLAVGTTQGELRDFDKQILPHDVRNIEHVPLESKHVFLLRLLLTVQDIRFVNVQRYVFDDRI